MMDKEGKKKKHSNEKRSPLQDLNGFPIHKPNTKRSSNLSSSSLSSSSSSGAAFSGGFRVLNSSKSSSSCSSRSHLDKKSRIFSKIAKDEPKNSTADTPKVLSRSRQNGTPNESFLLKSRRSHSQSLTERQSRENNAKPIYKNGQRSKISSAPRNPMKNLKKGSEGIQAKTKNPQENSSGEQPFELLLISNNSNLNYAENCTPVGKVTNECALDSVNSGSHKIVINDSVCENAYDNSANAVKTPPLEASFSPEIQCQSHSKMLVLKSAATPFCYGAGHLVSGITDKRRCRRRGSLKGCSQKINLFDDEKVSNDSQDSSIPSLAQASVRWTLSPCDDSKNRLDLDQHGVVCDDSLGPLDLSSSPSMSLCRNATDLLCADSSCNGSGSVGNVASKRRNRNAIVSLRNGMDESFFAISSDASYRDNLIGDDSTSSFGYSDTGNVIQKPTSDSSPDPCLSRLEVHDSTSVWSELDSMTETLKRVNLSVSPRHEMDSSPSRIYGTQIQQNVDSVSSWVSDTTLDNLALSQITISWQDELMNKIFETDERKETYLAGNNDRIIYPGFESSENKECDLRIDSDLDPVLLDHEPCISARGKEKSLLHRPNTCAESICTDGGGLVASDDSAWTKTTCFGCNSYNWK